MHWLRWTAPVASIAAVGALLTGCGGGGSAKQVSAAELAQRADEICATEQHSFGRIQAHPPPNASVAADQTDELVKATEDASSQLRALKPPDQIAAAYDRYLAARDRAVDQMKRGKDAAENQDSAAYGAAQAAVARDAPQRRKLARAVGLKACSSSAATA
jgi:hypothetical protein